jgi:hypothetical protein
MFFIIAIIANVIALIASFIFLILGGATLLPQFLAACASLVLFIKLKKIDDLQKGHIYMTGKIEKDCKQSIKKEEENARRITAIKKQLEEINKKLKAIVEAQEHPTDDNT